MIDDGFLNVGDHDSFTNGVPHRTFERLRRENFSFLGIKRKLCFNYITFIVFDFKKV